MFIKLAPPILICYKLTCRWILLGLVSITDVDLSMLNVYKIARWIVIALKELKLSINGGRKMEQKIINVKAIKEQKVLNEFATELKKGKHGQRDFLIFATGIYTGLRISDILNLKVSDVLNKTEADIIEQKTGKKRTLNLKQLTNLIIDYLNNGHSNQSDWLFYSPTDDGKKLSSHQYYKIMQKIADNLGLDYIGTHTMRKTFGYSYYQKYKDLPTLMRILNHSSQATTLRYIGIEDEQIQASLDDFSPFS